MNYLQAIQSELESILSIKIQYNFISGTNSVINESIMILSSAGQIDTILENDDVKECINTWIGNIRFKIAVNESSVIKQGEILESILLDLQEFEPKKIEGTNFNIDIYEISLNQHSTCVSNNKNECTFDVMLVTKFNLIER